MKIIHTDSFDGDYPNEKFVEQLPRLKKEALEKICDVINEESGENSPRYYRVVEDDYKLVPGFTP